MSHPSEDRLATLGFIVQCLAQGAITNTELRAWAEATLAADDDCPLWVEGLAEFDGPFEAVTHSLGFAPERSFTPGETAALAGIKHLRTGTAPDPAATPAGLRDHPEIVAEFRRTFPLLSLEPTT